LGWDGHVLGVGRDFWYGGGTGLGGEFLIFLELAAQFLGEGGVADVQD
jgi:hypothetical protein